MIFNEYVKIRPEKFGAVVFETLKEKIFVTNKIGKDILRLIQQNWTLDDIIKILENEYGEDNSGGSQIKVDVVDFIDELKKNEILVK